jgi:hypothetical protein
MAVTVEMYSLAPVLLLLAAQDRLISRRAMQLKHLVSFVSRSAIAEAVPVLVLRPLRVAQTSVMVAL